MPLGRIWCKVGLIALALLLAPVVPAQVVIDSKGILTVENSNLRMRFLGGSITSLVNKTTGEEYLRQPGTNWVGVSMTGTLESILETTPMSHGAWSLVSDPVGDAARIIFTGDDRTLNLTVGLDQNTEELFVRITSSSGEEGVQSAQWGIFGLDFDKARLIIPGQAGTYFGKDTTPEFVGLDYPTHWESQFVIYESEKGSMLAYAREAKPNFKRLHASRQSGNLDFGFEIFAVAPWETAIETPPFELRWKAFSSDWREPTRYYKEWWREAGPHYTPPVQEASGSVRVATDDRSWARDINVVITMLYLDETLLEVLERQLTPSQTLLYLTPWRKSGFDLNYPDYTPSDQAISFVNKAREKGFRIMLHANALGVSETNPNYERLKDLQLKLPNSREPVGWLWDLDPGNIRRVAYITPASSEYRRLFIDSIRPAIETLRPDVLHLDAGGTIQNDGNGLVEGINTIEGLIRFQKEIKDAFPGLLLGYESITEINAPFIDFAQRWSSDSPPHPVATYLFGDSTRFFGFLDQPAPDEEEFTDYLRRYEGQGILPTAPVASIDDFSDGKVRMQRLLQQLRLWQDFRLEPDWDSPWDGRIFLFKSPDGSHAAEVREDENVVKLSVDSELIYQRLRNVSTKQSDTLIRDWPGYGPDGLVGLDPSREYWLDSGVAPRLNVPRLTKVSDGIHITNDSFVAEDFALFGLGVNSPRSFSFMADYARARKGIFYRGFGEFSLNNGAVVNVGPVFVGKRVRNSTIVMHPPYRRVLGGVVFIEYTLKVPDAPDVRFEFDVAVADSAIRPIPALFALWVNGEEVWRDLHGSGRWNSHSVDLGPWRNQTIQLRMISGPGVTQNPKNAVTCWSNLRISTAPKRLGSTVMIEMPGGELAANSTNVWITRSGGSSHEASLDIPNKFAVFTKEPPRIGIGTNLLDLPLTNYRSAYNSMPAPYSTEWNGIVRDWQSGQTLLARALFLQPPTEGRIYSSWAVTLPESARRLQFKYGLMEALPIFDQSAILYSGASFHVFVNGEEVFDEVLETAGIHAGSIDLRPWAGQPVIIQVAVDAEGTAIFDWGYFADVLVGE